MSGGAGSWWSFLLMLSMLVNPSQQQNGNIQVRLMNGASANEGRVRLRATDREPWGLICPDNFGERTAAVVCRQVNSQYSWGEPVWDWLRPEGDTSPVYLSSASCQGTETNLGQCWTSPLNSPSGRCPTLYYTDRQDVGVRCYRYKVRVRPAMGSYVGARYGAVEVLDVSRSSWISLCDSDWDNNDARVACRSMGFVDGRALCCGRLSRGDSYRLRRVGSQISCSGNETNFNNCSYNVARHSTCASYGGPASAICYDRPRQWVDTGFGIRLSSSRQVEVKHLGVWGSVCSRNDTVADVACRQIQGHVGGVALAPPSTSQFQGSAWATSLNCSGNETSLEQCVVPPWGANTSCPPMHVLCYTSEAPVVELVGGSDGSHGRVEIVMDGSRYTVCDDGWNTSDANVVCRNKGYAGGIAMKGSHYGRGSAPVAMNNVGCQGNESSLLQCRSDGWLQSTESCNSHSKDASVYCHGHVLLLNGEHSNGIVNLMIRNAYRPVCGSGFGDVEASIVCRDLGFQHGRKLPAGSYGRFISGIAPYTMDCQGSETSVYNCSLTDRRCVTNDNTNYAAVHCYNGTLQTGRTMSLSGGIGAFANSSGHVRISQSGVQGKVCPLYWDNQDAKVVCGQLGFSQGLAYGLSTATVGPFLLTEINCEGTESSIFSCPTGSASCTRSDYSLPDGAVFCSNNELPQIQLVGGSSDSEGRVEVVYEGVSGTVCAPDAHWRNQSAQIVCRSLGYHVGFPKSVPRGTGPVAVDSPVCQGTESNLLGCRHQGFMAPPTAQCAGHNYDLGVACHHEEELTHVTHGTNGTVTGIVRLYKYRRWNYLCGASFSEVEAGMVCAKMGYSFHHILPKGALGRISYTVTTSGSGLRCNGTEASLGSCLLLMGACGNSILYDYASVLCRRTPATGRIRAIEPTSQPGEVLVEVDGVQSRVCSDQWNDNTAAVYCRDLGYNWGRAFGSYSSGGSTVRIVFKLGCNGSEGSLQDCTVDTSTGCSNPWTVRNARVFCYNSPEDFQVRLVGGPVRYEGNVEIGLNGQWGSVCDNGNSWTAVDSSVVCRSLGYAGGDRNSPGTYGPAAVPTFLVYPRCNGEEANITACPMALFHVNDSASRYRGSCTSRPASLRCTGEVKLQPNASYGALQMLVNVKTSSYGLVCADGFGPKEATVACRDLGFPYGLQMSGSAFGRPYYYGQIQRTNLQCSGSEPVLRDCSYSDSMGYCPSRKYASVVCSTLSPSTGYTVGVDSVQGHPYGLARVQHMGYWGFICPENFSDNDAAVVCRQSGYAGGIAFRTYYYTRYGVVRDIRWLKDLGCTGRESYLTQCRNVVWGHIPFCRNNYNAAVFCYRHSAPQFRLVNGNQYRGRLELWTEEGVGSVCGRGWTDSESSVVCRNMGFTAGRFLGAGQFGQGTGDVLVHRSWCGGSERSFFDCNIQLKGQTTSYMCNSHRYDAAIQCYNTTRLTGSQLMTYGRVEVLTNRTWVAVCDEDFDTNAARVVCRDLGYTEARPQCCSILGPLSHRSIGVKVNSCNGNEASLLECDVTLTSTCSSGKYASVLCSDNTIQENRLESRLVWNSGPRFFWFWGIWFEYTPQTAPHVGSVQANRYGFWGPVCDSNWDDRDANATCHGLGYNYGISFYGKDTTNQPLVLGQFQCTGQESSLADCQYADMDDDLNCSLPLRYAGVLCFRRPGIGLRLMDGGVNYGRVEVQFEGRWGRVTDNSWTDSDAIVVCRQLGYLSGRTKSPNVYSSRGPSKVWMTDVRCSGSERTLFKCFNHWDEATLGRWTRKRNVAVICNNHVRLTFGNSVSVGVVEVNINNRWGIVCDDHWSASNTRVTCENLGYENGFRLCCGANGRTSLALMESVTCKDSDTDLRACLYNVPGIHGCRSDSVAVACYNGTRPTAYSYRLAGGSQGNMGRVQITYMNVSGYICSDDWDDDDAKVFCSELGYPHGKAYHHDFFPPDRVNAHAPFWTTNVSCNGTESQLRDCQLEMGSVSQCRSRRAAGVLCTNTEGIFYRLQSNDSLVKGRVEMAVNGEWGSVCGRYFGLDEATVFCRSLGFNGGRVDSVLAGSYPEPPSTMYYARLACSGQEASLNECPHSGWTDIPTSSCTPQYAAHVHCFNDVRIGHAYDLSIRQGPVQFYHDGDWYNLCETGFDDVTARRVCQDLEYGDGKAVCCSAYGSDPTNKFDYGIHINYTMHCEGDEQSSADCIKADNCTSASYASVVCFNSEDYVNESSYSFDLEHSNKSSDVLAVTHMNVKGRVCNTDWDDSDARVMCSAKGYKDGIAFHYSQDNYRSLNDRGPFWVSSFNCTGNETSLNQCPFQERLHLGDCSRADMAGALCFNETGIQYRLSSDVPKANEGRVEISVGGVWGTVCRYYWDDRDASVFCRDVGYTDGYAIRNTFGTSGTGPMWLSRLRCKGTESTLHQCPHSGFSDTPVDDGYHSDGCSSHSNDAYVSCVDRLKLNTGYKANMGAVMVHHQSQWNLVCDSGLDHGGAQVVCRQLYYQFGAVLQGSKFGVVKEANVTIARIQCSGTETDITQCTLDTASGCRSKKYASVVCGNTTFIQQDPTLRLVRDSSGDGNHGYIEYQVKGVWGAVCANIMNTNSASVACKQLGFKGGVPYKPNIRDFRQPILTSDIQCDGTESSLDQCERVSVSDSASCDYSAARAGVFCYNDTEGISYRLAGDDTNNTRGRFEMKYMGQYGYFCSFHQNVHAARVACRSLGFADGMPINRARYLPSESEHIWLYSVICDGSENSLLECSSYGFNTPHSIKVFHDRYCHVLGPLSTQCYQQELAITAVRLADGGTNSSGRVEVFLQGPDQWGTVCDNDWNDVDATVVCNQLGYATGRAVTGAGFGEGQGKVWIDSVGCQGNETRLQDCGFNGYNVENCWHSSDAGAICSGVYVPPTETEKEHHSASTNTAAIVTPLALLLLAIIVGLTIILYRRHRSGRGFRMQRLELQGPAEPRSVSLSQSGVVRFINRVWDQGKEEEQSDDVPGISNPCYDSPAPTHDTVAGVLASGLPDYRSSDV